MNHKSQIKQLICVLSATLFFLTLFVVMPLNEQVLPIDTVNYEVIAQVDDELHAKNLEQKYGIVLKSLSKYGFATYIVSSSKTYHEVISSQDDLFYNNDLYETFDYTINDTRAYQQYALNMLELYDAWPYTTGSKDILVAIIDTGIVLDNIEFEGRLSPLSYNANTKEVGLEHVIDIRGHGSLVAGVIAANQNNNHGISGASPGVELLVIKANNDDNNTLYTSSIIEGINYAVEQGADIINMSFGSSSINYLMKSALEHAASEGVILIAASGNNANDQLFYPAAYDVTISVSSVSVDRIRSYFTSYGSTVDIAAPGSRIMSIDHNGSFVYVDGTSFASPYAAGVMALIMSYFPEMTQDEWIERLLFTSVEEGTFGKDIYYGYGIINAYNALTSELVNVTFESYEGTFIPPIKVKAGVPFGISFAPNLDYYYFDAWYLDEELTIPFVQRGEGIYEAITLYAKYVEGPPPPRQSEDFIYEPREEGIHILSYIGLASTITVPEILDDLPVVAIEKLAFAGLSHLRGVYLPSTLRYVRDSAFSLSENLLFVHFEDTDDPYQILDLGIALFAGCYSLEDLRLPNSLMILPRIFGAGTSGFAMPSLKHLTIPARVQSIESRVFYYSGFLETIFIEEGSLLQTIKHQAFFYSGIKAINLEVATMLRSIEEHAFANNNLETIILNSPIREIDIGAFRNNNISKVELMKTVETIDDRVFQENQIDELIIHEQIYSIGSYAFANNLLTQITLPSALEVIKESAFANNTLTGDLIIPATITSIGAKAFNGNNTKLTVYIPPTVLSMGDSLFAGTYDTVIITPLHEKNPDWDPLWNNMDYTVVWNASDILENEVFRYVKTSLDHIYILGVSPNYQGTHLEIPTHINGISVKHVVNGAFKDNLHLNSVHIKAQITSLEKAVFQNANNLQTLTFDPEVSLNVVKAFALNKTSLNHFDFKASLIFIGEEAFSNTSLQYVFLNNELEYVGKNAFQAKSAISLRIYYEENSIPPTWHPQWYHLSSTLITDYKNQTYIALFYDEDGTTLLRSETLKHGEQAGLGLIPQKQSDSIYDYQFSMWNHPSDSIIEDMVFIAIYQASYRFFEVSFLNHEGAIINTQTIQYGNAAEMVVLQDIVGHHFVGWEGDISLITKPTLFTPIYALNTYTVTFMVESTIYEEVTLLYGSSLETFPDVPINNDQEGIWDTQEILFIDQDITINASYGDDILTITFIGNDKVFTRKIFKGEDLTQIPIVPPLDYHQARWEEVEYTLLEEDVTIFAIYSIFTYTVIFIDEDDTLISTQIIEHGASATAPSEPSKEDNDIYFYRFAGWDAAFNHVTKDLVIKATYQEIALNYTVTFYDEDNTQLAVMTVPYSLPAIAPENPYKEATQQYTFVFNGWDKPFDDVRENLDIYATYLSIINTYTVTFYDFNDTLIEVYTVPYGSSLSPPLNPKPIVIDHLAKQFTSWSENLNNITDNLQVNALYEYIPLNQLITLSKGIDTLIKGTEWVDGGIISLIEGITYTISSNVDYLTSGQYTHLYTLYYDDIEIYQLIRIITVISIPQNIIITLNPAISTLFKGQDYIETGASSNVGTVEISGIVNKDIPGVYTIIYRVSIIDETTLIEHSTYKTRVVTVLNNTQNLAMHYKTFAYDNKKAVWQR